MKSSENLGKRKICGSEEDEKETVALLHRRGVEFFSGETSKTKTDARTV
jgi:hypothetical protein